MSEPGRAAHGADIVTLEDVHLTLGGFEALRGVSLGFAEGKSTVIMGPSGCGKSTLLKVAAGLDPPGPRHGAASGAATSSRCRSGRSWTCAGRTGSSSRTARCGRTRPCSRTSPCPSRFTSPTCRRRSRTRRVVRALERVGLEDSASERPAALSGGEKKIASFLRALITEPALLFMDEPTLSIDHAMTETHQPDHPRPEGARAARSSP